MTFHQMRSGQLERFAWGIFFFACFAQAQSNPVGSIGEPIVGLVANTERTAISPIFGVPTSSTISDPIGLSFAVSRIDLAPAGQWALVQMGPTGAIGRMLLNGIAPGDITPIDGAMAMLDLVSFSSNGQNSALVSVATGTLQVLTQLQNSPQMSLQFDVSQWGTVTSIAVSDDGTLCAVLMQSGQVYLFAANASPQLIFQAGSPAGITFLPGQPAVAIADGAAAMITVLDGLHDQPYTGITMAGPNLAGNAVFLQPSGYPNVLVLSATGAQTVYRIDLADQSITSLDIPVPVSSLDPVSGNVFVLSANRGEAAWLLSVDGTSLSATFSQPRHASLAPRAIPARPVRLMPGTGGEE